jgi:hypothetical protein
MLDKLNDAAELANTSIAFGRMPFVSIQNSVTTHSWTRVSFATFGKRKAVRNE